MAVRSNERERIEPQPPCVRGAGALQIREYLLGLWLRFGPPQSAPARRRLPVFGSPDSNRDA